ncbi:MAG: hypothetical protein QOG64_1882 [Acidimicrobiaceae bacterium]|nr:hypothetical protein [Acidimicrobiaceae bacterium]
MSGAGRRRRPGLAVLVVAMAFLAVSSPSQAEDQSPLERARYAADTLTFTGVVEVGWADQTGTWRSTTVQVRGGDGVLRMDGQDPARLAATSDARWLFRKGEWDLVATPDRLGSVPPMAKKYSFVDGGSMGIAGRATHEVELRTDGVVSERLYFDDATGLLLGRTQVDRAGHAVRTVWFKEIDVGDVPIAPARPTSSTDTRPQKAQRASAPYQAPPQLEGGYARVQILRRKSALQVVYSDGVHNLSVFEQPGRLDRAALPPGGQEVAVGPAKGLRFVWAGGQVVLWQAGSAAYTVVGDGGSDDVLSAARSVPAGRSLSTWQQVRQTCGDIVRAVAGG